MASWALIDRQSNMGKKVSAPLPTVYNWIDPQYEIHRHADIPKFISMVVSSGHNHIFRSHYDFVDHNLSITNLLINVRETVVAWIFLV